MSVNLLRSEMSAGGAYDVSGHVTLRFETDRVTSGKRTATIQCDTAIVEVNWGDGAVERFRGSTFTHEYETPGVYDVKVSTIGASRFTPRYATPSYLNNDNPAAETREGGLELIGVLDAETWRAGPDFNSAFFRTNLEFVDSSCQGVFNKITEAQHMFSRSQISNLYEGFNLPLPTLGNRMFFGTPLQTWPASGRMESMRMFWSMFQNSQLASFPVQDFGADTMDSNQAHRDTWRGCPIVQGGMVDNIKISPNTNSMPGWCNGWLVTTPPAMAIPSTVASIVGSFSNCPNLTAIPKEAVDCRGRSGPVNWSSGFASNCPNLTTIDFTWWKNMTTGINSMGSGVTSWIMPVEPMPFLLTVTDFRTIGARLNFDSTEAILNKLVEHITVFGAPAPNTRAVQLAGNGFYSGPLGNNAFLGFNGSSGNGFPNDLPQTRPGCVPIQQWTPEMIANKDTLVAAGIQVTYQDLSL